MLWRTWATLLSVNVVVEQNSFWQRSQLSHKTVAQYVAALRRLSVKCDFDANTDEVMRDQLLKHLQNDKIRARLLLEPDLTWEKGCYVAAAEQADNMKTDGAVVQATQSKPFHNVKHKKNPRPANSGTAAAAKTPSSNIASDVIQTNI